MEDFTKHAGLISFGLLGFFLSYLIDNEEMIFNVFRWLAVLAPTSYTAWRWIKESKKNNKKD